MRSNPSPGGSGPESARILVVEDNYLVAMQLSADLAAAGYEVLGPVNAPGPAIEMARRLRPALVIMDIRLSGNTDGIEAARAIFEETGIRSIFATAHSDTDSRKRAEPATPFGWLPKPYHAASLLAMIEAALSGRLR